MRAINSETPLRVVFLRLITGRVYDGPMPKKEKSQIPVGSPQFNAFLSVTGALVAELSWPRKKNRLTKKIAESLIAEAPGNKKPLSGKLKVERL